MPFIGTQPQVGAYSKLDAITTSATATYNLTLNSGAYYPSSANHLMVSLNGVMQAPQDSFTISGATIIFASTLASTDSIDFIMALGDVLDIGTPSDGTVVTAKIQNAAVTTAKIADNAITTAKITDGSITAAKINSAVSVGKVLQVVNFQTGVDATGTGVIPYDNTIPQITEGTEYMTLAITPTSATSRLRIDIVAMTTTNAANVIMQGALFVGTTADALASWQYDRDSVNGQGFGMLSGNHNMVAGVTTELTFRVRIGGDAAATTSFNGYVGLRRHGGVMASSITITEYTP